MGRGQLLNILSAGHSGSTTLDMLLGQMPGFFSTGELLRLTWQLGRDPSEEFTLCTCGATFRDCPVWGRVIPAEAFNDPRRFRLAFLQRQEWGATAPNKIARLPELLYRRWAERGGPTKLVRPLKAREIAKRNLALIDRLSEVTGASVIIDSTKSIERVHLLNRFRPSPVIVLMRDPMGLAASAIKYGRDPHRTVDAWLHLYRRYARLLTANDIRPVVVTYEEMCADPEAIQKRIASLFDVTGPVSEHHLVAGNPARYRTPFFIKEDRSWETVLPDDVAAMIASRKAEIDAVIARLRRLECPVADQHIGRAVVTNPAPRARHEVFQSAYAEVERA